jgi:hypothetical protein
LQNKLNIFDTNEFTFSENALSVFKHQAAQLPIYKVFIKQLGIDINTINEVNKIPFLPISFFKTHEVLVENEVEETFFLSSGTTQQSRSKHIVSSLKVYNESIDVCFQNKFGNIDEYCVVAMLPAYIDNPNSSLIYMVNRWIANSKHPQSAMYLDDYDALISTLKILKSLKQKTIFIGVTFALLDFARSHHVDFVEMIIIETGGMKGRGETLDRIELHGVLQAAFSTSKIMSEYGMTELLSQSYMTAGGRFSCPAWKRVLIRERDDPFAVGLINKAGGINIIDLANINSCAFIATDDLGIAYHDGTFEVLGRLDNSDLRGCNLLVV